MSRFILFKLIIYLILKINTVETAFNATAYALQHRCAWSVCNAIGYPTYYLNYTVDCCTLQLPLNYAQPDNRTINISMTRLRSNQTASTNNTIFALTGGPGFSGWNLFYLIPQFFSASFGVTIILPDHRGTGLSTLLSCDDKGSQDVSINCINYLISKFGVDGLNQFSVTSAAHDLSVQIQSYQADYPGRFVAFGISYGTFWLNRFLTIYPNVVQTAIMDGIVNPISSSDSRDDALGSSVAEQFLSFCQLQTACIQNFPPGQSPNVMLRNILTSIDSNTQQCIKKYLSRFNITSEKLRDIFFTQLASTDAYLDRTIIPAVIYRLYRCNSDDRQALNLYFRTVTTAAQTADDPNGPGFLLSKALNFNVIQSETYLAKGETEIDNTTILNLYHSTIMASATPLRYYNLRSQWPKYPIDQYRYQIANYTPICMLSGQLDPSTIFDQASQVAAFTTNTRKFYAIPLASHVTVSMASLGYMCSLQLISAWAFPKLFPSEWATADCIESYPTTFDFAAETNAVKQISMKFFNTTVIFGLNISNDDNSISDAYHVNIYYSNLILCSIFTLFYSSISK
ncbi:unnamed protein product [Adineta steineri]|uniref:AB hydrolase-1 domain-containing protein n=1 Tax=Adineta steineri TaxID=433720 RepID=A0A814TER8_9BILA|nr:unnamed protein product [Adineta steineri]CAF1160864.1 unnamed protein product [Adineta steineri]